MLKTKKFNWRGVCFFLALLFMVSVQAVRGYEERGRGRDTDRNRQENPRREQMRQEAQASAPRIQEMLTQILEAVNQNQQPDEALVTQAASLLEDNKRSVPVYDDAQKSQYMLLQAWTYFYQGSPDDAMNWSLRACKMDESNRDAWISQALFCMLNGKRPLEPRVRRPNPRRDQVNGEMDNGGYGAAADPYGRKGTLDFELGALRKEMLKERFGRIEFKTPDGSKVEYTPGENTLCILFWQVKPAVVDANDVSVPQTTGQPEAIGTMRGGLQPNLSQKLDIDKQRQYLANIYQTIQEHPEITCLTLNTNKLQDAKIAAAQIDEDFVLKNKAPIVFAAELGSGASAYLGLDAQVPFMLMADKEGIVRYAGPAADFMPAMILSHLTGIEIPLGGADQNKMMGGAREPDMRREMRAPDKARPGRGPSRGVVEPNQPAIDPNVPAVDPNHPVAVHPVKKNADKPAEVTPEESVDADHLLALAQMEIETCRTMRGKSPAKGIDACKKVLEKYPNTPYAEQAREQLRRVPQRYWERYGITELLGY